MLETTEAVSLTSPELYALVSNSTSCSADWVSYNADGRVVVLARSILRFKESDSGRSRAE
jgi:hypothetical protein